MTGERAAPELQVLIVGAGVGRLSLAGFLHAAGVEPVVVETTDTLAEPDGVVELWPEALTLCDDLGVAAALRTHGVPITDWTLRRRDGTVTAYRQAHDAGVLAVRYPRLRATLCASLPARTVRTATTLQSLERTGTTVTAAFTNGVTEQFDVVVGADGATSRTRACLGGAALTRYGTATRAYPLPQRRDRHAITEWWPRDGTVVRTLPTSTQPVALVTTSTQETGDTTTDRPPTAVPQLTDRLATATPLWHRVDVGIESATWATGRVALIGDAAHASHRLTGLGATLAIEDAAVLRTALVGAHREPMVEARLAEYAATRRTRLRRGRTACPAGGPFAAVESPLMARHPELCQLRGRQLRAWFDDTATAGPG